MYVYGYTGGDTRTQMCTTLSRGTLTKPKRLVKNNLCLCKKWLQNHLKDCSEAQSFIGFSN